MSFNNNKYFSRLLQTFNWLPSISRYECGHLGISQLEFALSCLFVCLFVFGFCYHINMGRGACRATVHGVAESWTQLSNWAHTHIISTTASLQLSPCIYSYFLRLNFQQWTCWVKAFWPILSNCSISCIQRYFNQW